MKRTWTSSVPTSLIEAFKKVPLNRSKAIEQAVKDADNDPEVLVRALRMRLTRPFEANDAKIAFTRDKNCEDAIERLAEMTKLPNEQVLRLCMEAYIHGH